ncbi:FAD-binding oxidoreductase [Puia sp.]|jgi:glycolate oxidase|uniref:FAD-binding oxidoreductase n=1 Tax=Puia sp. TaxID=2045100 RepID=UPI002F3E38DF
MTSIQSDARLQQVIGLLETVCGCSYVITGEEDLRAYGSDETQDLYFPFDILVKPADEKEIGELLRICNRYRIPVTPRGGGSGVTGGALPVQKGVVLSTERLNKIITINETDRYVIAECGVITQELCEAVEEKGLFFPVAPTSRAFSFVGGNVAENAGSMYSCKYGTTSRYVINLQVVLPNGEIFWTGANVEKNATGLDLTRLFVGSEGLLGVITKVVFRLLPKPRVSALMLTGFDDLAMACEAVIAIRRSGLSPAAAELIGHSALQLTRAYLKESFPLTADRIKAHLLIELNAADENRLAFETETVAQLLGEYTQDEIFLGSSSPEKERLWMIRRNIGNALKSENRLYRDIDVCIPLSFVYRYISGVEEICKREGVAVACFGHVLDGNLHTMLHWEKASFPGEDHFAAVLHEIYDFAISNGGVISGEHGIGYLQKEFMPLQFPASSLRLMKEIKTVFDPEGIMNPGKVL